MFSEIKAIIWKNLQRLVAKPVSAAAILVGPFLVLLLAGIAFTSTELTGVNIGITQSDAFQGIFEALEDKKFDLIDYSSEEKCIEDVKRGALHVCIAVPQQKNESIQFYVDYSRLNLVYVLINSVSESLAWKEEEISQDIVSNLLEQVKQAVTIIDTNKEKINEISSALSQSERELDNVKRFITDIKIEGSVDTGEVKSSINSQKRALDESKDEILTQSEELKTQLEGFKTDLLTTKDDVDLLESDLDSAVEQAAIVIENLQCEEVPDVSGCAEVLQFRDQLLERQESVQETKQKIINAIIMVDQYIIGVDETTDKAIVQNEMAKVELEKAEGKIKDMTKSYDSTKKNLESKKQEMSSRIDSFKDQTKQIADELKEANKDIEDLVGLLSSTKTVTPAGIINPLSTEIKPVQSSKTILEYIFPTVLTFVIMFVSILLASTLILRERVSPAYFRNHISPTREWMFIVGSFLTSFFVLVGQIIVVLVSGYVLFGVILASSFKIWIVGLTVILVPAIAFLLLGMAIGYFSPNEEVSTLMSIVFASILFLFSGAVAPIEKMAPWLAGIAKFNPYYLAQDSLRQVMIHGASFSTLGGEILLLVFAIVILAVVVIAAELYQLRRD